MLPNASVTDSLVTLATHIINDLGVAGVALLNITSAVIGLPGTEATMLFGGFNVFQHHLTMLGIIAFGVLGDLIGASIAYVIGSRGLHEILDKLPGPLHVSPHGLDRAHAWFERFGTPAVLVSRVIPLIRSAFPYAAGTAEMAYTKFIALAAVGSVVWIGGLAFLGKAVGSNWSSWRKHLDYVDYAVVALVVVAIGWLVLKWWRGRGTPSPAI
jgi:membrane protein DedA with SNARE-associated domain